MAVVQGIKEKVHLPIYDSVAVEPEKQLRDAESTSTLKFFVNVQGKTKLETNLQSASLLPHYNTFEARAMRVVISDLPPKFSDEVDVEVTDIGVFAEDPAVTTPDLREKELRLSTADTAGTVGFTGVAITADFGFTLDRVIDLLREARESEDKEVELDLNDEEAEVTLFAGDYELNETQTNAVLNNATAFTFAGVSDLVGAIEDAEDEKKMPPSFQFNPRNGSGSLVGKLIYNTVTTFFVGEKEMIKMPTWFFPGGAGPYSEAGTFATHGEPNPTATFRFAEPIFIDKQQNFRVEIEIPDSDVLKELHRIYGPLFIWVVLDGYMTRDVQ